MPVRFLTVRDGSGASHVSSSAAGNGSGRSTSGLMMLNTAVFAPMPSARISRAMNVKPASRRKPRSAKARSWRRLSIVCV